MLDVLVYGDTIRTPELRHEVPLALFDPFLYAERGGRRHVVITEHEWPQIEDRGIDVELVSPRSLGLDELLGSGRELWEIGLELSLRAVRELGVVAAAVPPGFPVELADHLRAHGIELTVDRRLFAQRRRSKNDRELAGIRRAQRAAEAAMDAARDLLRRTDAAGPALVVDGAPLTAERVKRAIIEAVTAAGCTVGDFIVSHGAQAAVAHELGSGVIAPGEPIVVDLAPKDGESACHSDMTRTFCVGEVPDELRDYHALVRGSLERSVAAVRAGVDGSDVFATSCEPFHRAGYKTLLNRDEGELVEDGFFHLLGHGVGLEGHEPPMLGPVTEPLVAGDVITLEPGLYRRGFGGCRLEDVVLVTEDGAENLTKYPYDLEP